MLLNFDDGVLNVLAAAFQLRLLKHVSEDTDHVWDTQVVPLLKKRLDYKTIQQFGHIAIIPVLRKLYSRVLLLLALAL